MAYFGRKPEKPGSVPGSQSGFVQQQAGKRAARAVRRFAESDRPERQARVNRQLRAFRTARLGREAR